MKKLSIGLKYKGEKMKPRRKETAFYAVTIICCLVAMIVVVVAALLIYDKLTRGSKDKDPESQQDVMAEVPALYSQSEVDLLLAETVEQAVSEAETRAKEEARKTVLDFISQSLGEGQSVIKTLRPLYPDKLIVASGGIYHFLPINRDLLMHERLQENVQILETGEYRYVEGEQVVSRKGIDVSRYQGKIDWSEVASDGVEYVFIRVGFRGYGKEGNIVLDDMFVKNIEGAQAAGLKVGAYFVGQAITVEEAKEEAQFVMEQLAPYVIDYPVVYDVEKTAAESGRMNSLDATTRTDVVIAFLEEVKAAGYKPMIYANTEMYAVMLEFERLEQYDKWYAYYGEDLFFPYNYDIWQYSEKGTVKGIDGAVDLNISFKTW